jgi:hypothetical protein
MIGMTQGAWVTPEPPSPTIIEKLQQELRSATSGCYVAHGEVLEWAHSCSRKEIKSQSRFLSTCGPRDWWSSVSEWPTLPDISPWINTPDP